MQMQIDVTPDALDFLKARTSAITVQMQLCGG